MNLQMETYNLEEHFQNYECAGVICTDGNQSAKGIRTGKDTGVPDNTNRSKNSDSD